MFTIFLFRLACHRPALFFYVREASQRAQIHIDLVAQHREEHMASLPSFIFNGWRLRQGEERKAWVAEQFKDITTSSLAEAFINLQLDKHFATSKRSVSIPSLASLAVGSILENLESVESSDDLAVEVETVAESLSSTTLRQLLSDPRTPYHLLRKFLTLPQTLATRDRSIVDVDELVLQNERYVRSRDSNRDDRYLVTLENLSNILAKAPQDDRSLSFVRKDPPKGGLETLDVLRKRVLTIQASSASFGEVFTRITRGALRGLDWSNVLVVGGSVLTTLLHTDPSKDDDEAVRDPDIDMCIYGLGPQDANRKVKEIYDIWVRNLPGTAQARLVVKNCSAISLIPSYPHRRIQIILRLPPSPTDALLKSDLDVCAIGFDGSRVLMLPRCARAIETGYSVFTMALIWGHELSERRASRVSRIFKYADRGFGLRILPSYARSLEEDDLEATISQKVQPPAFIEQEKQELHGHDDGEASTKGKWCWLQRDRKPHGCSESGLKTLKRIAYLGQDFVQRFLFGVTPLAISKGRYDRQRQLGHVNMAGAEHAIHQEDEDEWLEQINQTNLDNKIAREAKNDQSGLGVRIEGPGIDLTNIDTNKVDGITPNNRTGLENFEVFMRQCEAWKLHVRGEATVNDLSRPATLDYEGEFYDDLPNYEWNSDFKIDALAGKIEYCNDGLWVNVKRSICRKLGIATRTSGCKSSCFPKFFACQRRAAELEGRELQAWPKSHAWRKYLKSMIISIPCSTSDA